ncbi:MAG: ABC transporter ATP-binding protein [Dorea sp.]
MSIIEVKDFSFAYPSEKEILHAMNVSIEAGEFVLLCGPSGCGKTTLLRCMKSQIAPTGRKKGKITELPAKDVGFVFQNPDNQIVTDTVRHELAFGIENMGLASDTIRRRVAETALFFGIDEWIDASVHEISGGQKQLLNLASVIAMRPKILLLDEPVSQLDPSAKRNFLDLLVRVNRELGIAVLLSEHHLETMLPFADRVLFMKDGYIQYEGTAQEYVKYVLEHEMDYLDTLPAASKIAFLLGEKEKYPLTVRDGRKYLEEYRKQSIRSKNDRSEVLKQLELKSINRTEDNVCLWVDHIWFQYHRQTPFVIKGLELKIQSGEFHVILGGNGSGKTTLLSILGKRLYADRGKIRLGKRRKMPTIELLTQNPKAMFSKDTVEEELKEAGCSQKMIEELHLENLLQQHPYDLSGGEQQRLGLALVLVKEPDLLLLDEPTKGLDITVKKELGENLQAYVKKGHAVLCVTHDVEFAAMYAEICSLLFEGEILSTAPTKEFFDDNAFYTTDMIRVLRGFH